MPDEVARYLAAPRVNGVPSPAIETKLILAHLVSLAVVKSETDSVAIQLTEPNIGKMHVQLRQSIINFVTGYSAPQVEAELKN